MNTFKLTLFSFLCFVSTGLFSQTNQSNTKQKNCRYTFGGELSSQTKTELENSIAKLQFVTSAKIKYKADSKVGELFLTTEEKVKTSEGDDTGFNAVELKKLMLSFNINPLEFTVLEN